MDRAACVWQRHASKGSFVYYEQMPSRQSWREGNERGIVCEAQV